MKASTTYIMGKGNISFSDFLKEIFFLHVVIKINQNTNAVADLGFPRGGGANPPGGPNIRFCQIFRKTAWN